MRCPHCGNEQESGKFCNQCGLVIPRPRKPVSEDGVLVGRLVDGDDEKHKCPECGYVFRGRRCGNCGTLYRSTLI